jgi:predicted phage baseplate assembly protein
VEVLQSVAMLLFTPKGVVLQTLAPDQRLDLLLFPISWWDGIITWFLVLHDGMLGIIGAAPGQVRFHDDDPGIELVTITSVAADRKSIAIDPPLAHRYDPPSVTVKANLAPATHGESVRETFAGGDATRPFQRFPLQQTPLTYVGATTPSGVRSTLRVWVDDVEWREVPALYGRGPNDRVFITRRDGEGKTWIQFGDGVTGARLPTGQRNVRAVYRRGIGTGGILKSGQINLLLDRLAGLKDAANVIPSTDGKDPEALENARRNAPLTVLTLDRVVSLRDFEDFALAYAGIYKAVATWSWFRGTRGVSLTVAGFEGGEVSLALRRELGGALAKWGDPFVPTDVANHVATTFRTGLRVKVDADRESAKVLKAVELAVRRDFSFERRSFGQRVSLAEVAASAQGVPGVVAVQVTRLYRSGDTNPGAGLVVPLPARAPQPGARGTLLPAELVTLDPAPLDLLEELS